MGTLWITAFAVLLAACSSSADSGSTTTTSEPAPATTTTSQAAEEAAVEQAYRGFWDAYLAAADPMSPTSPRLAAAATGDQLETIQKAFLARKSAGEVIRGDLELAPRVVSVVGDTATVRDCYLDNTGVYNAATGDRKDTASGVRHLITASMVREDGVWKVSDLTREGDGCVAA